jgi:hypothetical protein
MIAVHCPSVPTRTGLTLVPESRVVRLTDDGAGTITMVIACYAGHLHEVVTGRATTDAAATPLRRPAPVPVAAAC